MSITKISEQAASFSALFHGFVIIAWFLCLSHILDLNSCSSTVHPPLAAVNLAVFVADAAVVVYMAAVADSCGAPEVTAAAAASWVFPEACGATGR